MSEMPRIWWSPWLGRFLRQPRGDWSIGYLDVETGHFREQLPDDAVELAVAAGDGNEKAFYFERWKTALKTIEAQEETLADLRQELARLRSAGDGTADVERRSWQAKPGEPICNRMYSGEYWVAKTCIQALGHGGGHADWYGRTWCKDERDSAGDGATDVRVEWGADLRDTEDPGPRVCGGEWSARVLAEREPENRLLRRTVTTSEWEVVDR